MMFTHLTPQRSSSDCNVFYIPIMQEYDLFTFNDFIGMTF